MRRGRGLGVIAIVLVLAYAAWRHLGMSLGVVGEGLHNAVVFFHDAWPPSWDVLGVAMEGLVATLEIAFLGTLIGTVVSLPLAVLAARNLFWVGVSGPVRALFAAVRVIPSILWAILFVIIMGPGAPAGVLAIAFYTIGFLGKFQYEAIEGLPRITLETAQTMGLPKWEQVRYVVLPESGNHLVSHLLFMFEYNVRASTIIGVVGAGGIGFALNNYLRFLQYDAVLMILLVMYATVLVIDGASMRIRRRFQEDPDLGRPRWRDVFMPTTRQAVR
ncbi:MAG: phosphonate ABC transporter, permease protein PhnE [Euryarchaeota archaeon]|nr:phosphonate ABC transporter, permease protein PhnE [Euryarchaeota archaeon]